MNLAGISVTWEYGTKPVMHGKNQVAHKTTTCRLFNGDNGGEQSATISKHHNDKESIEKARKISLSRAMQAAGINKLQRTAMWLAYRNSKQGGRW